MRLSECRPWVVVERFLLYQMLSMFTIMGEAAYTARKVVMAMISPCKQVNVAQNVTLNLQTATSCIRSEQLAGLLYALQRLVVMHASHGHQREPMQEYKGKADNYVMHSNSNPSFFCKERQKQDWYDTAILNIKSNIKPGLLQAYASNRRRCYLIPKHVTHSWSCDSELKAYQFAMVRGKDNFSAGSVGYSWQQWKPTYQLLHKSKLLHHYQISDHLVKPRKGMRLIQPLNI